MSMPQAVCLKCNMAYRIEQNGVLLVVPDGSDHRPLLKAASDKYKCPSCGHEILIGFGKPLHYGIDPDFDRFYDGQPTVYMRWKP